MKYFYYFCFLIIIVFCFSYYNSSVEQFTPTIRQIYRPIIRNTRLFSEDFYNKISLNISNFLRKIKII